MLRFNVYSSQLYNTPPTLVMFYKRILENPFICFLFYQNKNDEKYAEGENSN